MNVKPIRNDRDLKRALLRIDQIIDARQGTPEHDELEVLTAVVESYENAHCPVDPPDPVEAIKFRMEQAGLTGKDVAILVGGKNRLSEILNRRRTLSKNMVYRLHEELKIPYESLITSSWSSHKHLKHQYA